jgi:tRNA threonylcarbamoyladenosine biosynthesis protein TsaE
VIVTESRFSRKYDSHGRHGIHGRHAPQKYAESFRVGVTGYKMTFSLDEIGEVVKELIRAARDSKVWLFYGEMGAGKTTLIKAICKEMGVHSTMTSPTFSIVNEYDKDIYHFDFYRLKNEVEAYDIGVEEYLDSGKYCFIEWPERIPSLLPTARFEIRLEIENPTHRRIHYQRYE